MEGKLNSLSRTIIMFLVLAVGLVFSSVNVDAATNYYPAKVGSVKAVSAGYDAVKVTWGKTARADGYKVYRATSKNGKYSLVKTTTARSFTNTNLKTNKTYYYVVKAYNKVKVKGKTKTYLSKKYSSKVSAKPVLTIGKATAKATAYNKINVSWGAGKNAKGYVVYRAESKNGKYTKIKATTSRSYTDTVKTGKSYYYKVASYNCRSGKYQYSASSNIVGAKTTLGTVANVSVVVADESITVKWSSVAGATKYLVQRNDGSEFVTFKTYYTDTTASVGKEYSYKVVAYNGVYGGWSKYSNIVSIAPKDEPVVPEEPTEPEQPDEPEVPDEPDTPSEPEVPSEPDEPSTPSEPSEPVDPEQPDEPSTPVEPETPDSSVAYINYNKDGNKSNVTRIELGMVWSDSLNAQLNGGTPVKKLLTRNSKVSDGDAQDVYCFDTVDFDNFLIVYVKNGKVNAWMTTAKSMGVYNGVELIRGTSRSNYSQFKDFTPWSGGYSGPYIPASKVSASNIAVGEIYFGGVLEGHPSWDYGVSNDLIAEEQLCEYTVNAFRVINGKSILSHNDYLYGDGTTYGAKAWSATQAVNGELSHSALPNGYLANVDMTARLGLTSTASGKTLSVVGENVATSFGGEIAANGWYTSTGHSQTLMATNELVDYHPTSIMASAVVEGADGLYYWTWHNGNLKIDYGIGTPVLSISNITDTSATVSWGAVADVAGYQLEFYTDEGCTTLLKRYTINSSTSEGTMKIFSSGTTYYVQIRAKKTVDGATKWGEWSELVNFTTL